MYLIHSQKKNIYAFDCDIDQSSCKYPSLVSTTATAARLRLRTQGSLLIVPIKM